MKEITEIENNLELLFQIKPLNSENDKYVIILGQFRVSKLDFPSKIAAVRYLKTKPWEIIFNTATLIAKGVFLEGFDKFINQPNTQGNGNN